MGEIKSPRTIHRESKILYEIWKDTTVGTAKGWFTLGAAWALAWTRWGVRGSASKFAGENEWECDEKRRRR